jgi:cytochrome-b5 reductase
MLYRCVPPSSPLRGLNQAIRFRLRRLSDTNAGARHRGYTKGRRALTLVLAFGTVAGTSCYLFYPDVSRSAPTSTKLPLSPSHFTPATIVSSESCGPDSKLIQLVVSSNLLPPSVASNPSFAPIWSVFIKDDDIQVERPYTPLQGIDEQGRMLFWIKKYPKGEVGRWLHSKVVGDQVEIRGPLKTWSWKDDEWDEIVLVCDRGC